ncbi:MAG: ATP synthase F1 subunit gamma [Myxococcales bacterium]|nr:ATP synthase F1 subunit gamma [Myxococcales bacterium]
MASLRDLRKRLKAVKNTQKITKAMKMVAASKLRRAQQQVIQARPYAIGMQEVLEHIMSHADVAGHPLLQARVPQRIELLVLSSNRGLCGSFNSSIIRATERYIADHQGQYEEILMSTIGRKVADHFRRKNWSLIDQFDTAWDDLRFEQAQDIATHLANRFQSGRLDGVFLVYNEFKSAIAQNVVLAQLLPIQPLDDWDNNPAVRVGELEAFSGDARAVAGLSTKAEINLPASWQVSPALSIETEGYEHRFEPSRAEVLDSLLPQHLAVQIWRAMLESTAAEHGARMSAMDAASTNAKELIEKITLQANRLRQAGITSELMEIVSGAEALR